MVHIHSVDHERKGRTLSLYISHYSTSSTKKGITLAAGRLSTIIVAANAQLLRRVKLGQQGA